MMDRDRGSFGADDGVRAARWAGRSRWRWAATVMACAATACWLPTDASAAVASAGSAEASGTVSSLSHGLGLIPTPSATASADAIAQADAAAATVPASVDLTPYAMPVGDQGQVGSCAAWATDYTALGYWENKQGITGGGLEPMFTYSQVTGGVDRGSSIEGNLQVDQSGVDTQGDYWQGNFDYTDMPTSLEKAAAVNWKLTSFSNLAIVPSVNATTTRQSIEVALAAGTPVVIGIPVYDNFFYVTGANNGYYSGPSGSFEGYHAITALGYNANGLVIENSWGSGWGNKGFATLSWSFVNGDVFDAVAVGALTTGQPVSATAPAVTGTAAQGQTLTASAGTWSPAATSYAYQWERAAGSSSQWSAISGATAATYVPVGADLGQRLRVLVTATDGRGPGAAPSAAIGPVAVGAPVSTAAPGVTGTPRVGQTLTATSGSWNPAATSYAYEWQRSTDGGATWASITGATGTTYVLGSADSGAKVRVQVTATNGSGRAQAWAVVGPIASGVPVNTAVPAVSGTARQGQTLTASTGTWNPSGTGYAYQWQRSGNGGATWSPISGATAATYLAGSADVGSELRVTVTSANAFGTVTAGSAATAVVVSAAPVNSGAPTVAGTAVRGSTLTASAGTWNPAAASYAYQWQRSSNGGITWSPIVGATGVTYSPAAADENVVLRMQVTAVNAYGQATAASAATTAVKASPPVMTAAPAIVGSARVGVRLTATAGGWSGVGNTYTYQWQRGSGSSWSNIAGATGLTYTVAVADAGQSVRMVVTAVNSDARASEASAATAKVTATAAARTSATATRARARARARLKRR
jgi:C1A family cysteine protease